MGDEEAGVRAAAERLVAAFGSGRLDDYFACFADDATFVFYTTPQRLESVDAYRQLWDGWARDDGFRVTPFSAPIERRAWSVPRDGRLADRG
jgi:ketosteroid isomerase-like protein